MTSARRPWCAPEVVTPRPPPAKLYEQVAACHGERRRKGREPRGEDTDDEGECCDREVDADGLDPWKAVGQKRQQSRQAPPACRESERRGNQGEHETFEQQLLNDPRTPGAQRFMDCQFGSSALTTHQQQVGHVRAGNQQQEPDGRHQRQHRGADAANDRLREGTNHGDEVASAVRPHDGFQPARQRCELAGRLFDGDTRPKPAKQIDLLPCRISEWPRRRERARRPPHFHADGVIEIRHHAHDGEPLLTERDSPAQDVWRAAVAACPQRVAHHEHMLRSFHVVGPRQRAPEKRMDSEDVKKVAGNRGGVDVGCGSVFADDVGAGVIPTPRDGLEQLAGVANGVNLGPAKGMMGESRGSKLFPGDDEPLFVANGHPAQQDALDQREHHRGPGKAQRERQGGCHAERLRPEQRPPREPAVGSEVFEHGVAAYR